MYRGGGSLDTTFWGATVREGGLLPLCCVFVWQPRASDTGCWTRWIFLDLFQQSFYVLRPLLASKVIPFRRTAFQFLPLFFCCSIVVRQLKDHVISPPLSHLQPVAWLYWFQFSVVVLSFVDTDLSLNFLVACCGPSCMGFCGPLGTGAAFGQCLDSTPSEFHLIFSLEIFVFCPLEFSFLSALMIMQAKVVLCLPLDEFISE